MLDVRVGELDGAAAVEDPPGVVWVDRRWSTEAATRAVRAVRPDLSGPAAARAVAVAYGSPVATPAGRSADTGRHRRPGGVPAAALAVGPAFDEEDRDARRPVPRWARRVKLLTLAAAVLVLAPPFRPLTEPPAADAATPVQPGRPAAPAPHRTPATHPASRPAVPGVPGVPPPVAAPRRSVPAATRAAGPAPAAAPRPGAPARGPAATSTRPGPAPTAPAPTTAPGPTSSPAPSGPADPLPTLIGGTCQLLPLPVICPTP
jgi:hypothetical protein